MSARLLDPIQLGPRQAPTRVVSLPHGQLSLGPVRLRQYFDEITAAGIGMVVLGGSVVSPESHGVLLNPLFEAAAVDSIEPAITAVHDNGALFITQLLHIGAQTASFSRPFFPVVAPSAVPTTAESPAALGTADVARVRQDFLSAAVALAERGSDGFELHAAHNYLLHQFLSPGQNQRTDEYGGDLRGRSRLITEIATELRERLPGHVVGIRLGFGTMGKYGQSVEETLELCQLLDSAGLVDYITVSVPSFPHLYVRDESFPEAGMRGVAKQLKSLVSAKINLSQRVLTPELGDDCIQSGDTDMVGIARELLADPRWASRVGERSEELRPCVNCMQGCRPAFGIPVSCDVNPTTLATALPTLPLPIVPASRVVVVGGGPAGCEAALSAAAEGAQVVLFDAEDSLGGRARIAGEAPYRSAWSRYADYLERSVRSSDAIKLQLGTVATAELIEGEKPDHVVSAVGARVVIPSAAGDQAVSPDEFLRDSRSARGKHVVVYDEGGRWDAINAVDAAVASGAESVAYVTPRERVGDRVPEQSRWSLRERISRMSVSVTVGHDPGVPPTRRSVGSLSTSGATPDRESDVLLVWCGMLASRPLDLPGDVPVTIVGDALSPRGLGAATKEGRAVGAVARSHSHAVRV